MTFEEQHTLTNIKKQKRKGRGKYIIAYDEEEGILYTTNSFALYNLFRNSDIE